MNTAAKFSPNQAIMARYAAKAMRPENDKAAYARCIAAALAPTGRRSSDTVSS